nr:MAG TPA: hypothetical protein [Inoviridae sp.]
MHHWIFSSKIPQKIFMNYEMIIRQSFLKIKKLQQNPRNTYG